jgi:hypothetical protein
MDGSFMELPAPSLKPGHFLALPFDKTALITVVQVGRQYVNLSVRDEHGALTKARYNRFAMVAVLNLECPGCGLYELQGPYDARPDGAGFDGLYYECQACERHLDIVEVMPPQMYAALSPAAQVIAAQDGMVPVNLRTRDKPQVTAKALEDFIRGAGLTPAQARRARALFLKP